MKEMFPPEKCPECGEDTVVMHYKNGYRVECPKNVATMYDNLSPKVKDCNWFDEFHFDSDKI